MFAADPYLHTMQYPYPSSDPSQPCFANLGASAEELMPSWPPPDLAEQQGAFMAGPYYQLPDYSKLHSAAGMAPYHHMYADYPLPPHPGAMLNQPAAARQTGYPATGLPSETPATNDPNPPVEPQPEQQTDSQATTSNQPPNVEPASYPDPTAMPSMYAPSSMPMLYPGLHVPGSAPMQFPMPMHPYLPYPPPFRRMAPGLFPYHPYAFGASPTPGSPMSSGSEPGATGSPSASSQPGTAPFATPTVPAAAAAAPPPAPAQPAAIPVDHGKSTLNVENVADNLVRIERRITCPTYTKRLHVTQFMAENLLPTEHDKEKDKDKQKLPLNYNYELVFKHKIWLIDDEMVSWPVEYEGVVCCAQRHYRLTAGWRNFVRAKNMKVGDSVIMERRGQNRHNIYVKVVRGPAIVPKARASRSKKTRINREEDEEEEGSLTQNDTTQAPDAAPAAVSS